MLLLPLLLLEIHIGLIFGQRLTAANECLLTVEFAETTFNIGDVDSGWTV